MRLRNRDKIHLRYHCTLLCLRYDTYILQSSMISMVQYHTYHRDHVHFLGLVGVSLQRVVVIREQEDALVVHRLLAADRLKEGSRCQQREKREEREERREPRVYICMSGAKKRRVAVYSAAKKRKNEGSAKARQSGAIPYGTQEPRKNQAIYLPQF